jgi:hypothetical protein
MRNTLFASSLLALLASASAYANPVEINKGGSPAQSQVYGDDSNANSNRNTTTSNANSSSKSNANSISGSKSNASVGNVSGGKSSASVGNVSSKGGVANVTVNVSSSPSTTSTTNVTKKATAPTRAAKTSTAAATRNTAADPSTAATDPSTQSAGSSTGSGYASNNRPVSTAAAPAVTSFNSCAGSPVSAGIQGASFGISFGSGNKFDRVCWLNESGRRDAAIEYICLVDATAREAMKNTAEPCAADRPQAAAVVAPAPAVPALRTDYKFDWCYTKDAGNAEQAKVCDREPVTQPVPAAAQHSAADHRGFFARLFG